MAFQRASDAESMAEARWYSANPVRAICIAGLLLCAGCSTAPSTNAHWWNPATWGSTREANKTDRLTLLGERARTDAIKEAQKTAHETYIALADKEAVNARDVASEANQQTVLLLDQAAGPLTAAELDSIRQQVRLLLSSNAALRQQGDNLRQESRKTVAELSERLASVQGKLAEAQAALPDALRREASLANAYRNLVFGACGLGALALILCGVVVYLRVAYGGVFGALGAGLSRIYSAHPNEAQNIELLLSKNLSPSVLEKILAKSA